MGKTIEVYDSSFGSRFTVEHVASFAHVGDDGDLAVTFEDGDTENFGWDHEVIGMW